MNDNHGHDLSSMRVSSDDAISEVTKARTTLAKLKRELSAVTKDRDELLVEFDSLQKAKYPEPVQRKKTQRKSKDRVRVICCDVHGSMMDRPAVEAFLADLKKWDPDEVVLLGDIVECGGFLAAHHTLGYVAQTEYSWQEDIACGNWFLDQIAAAAPNAEIHYLEGNHECLHPDHEVLTSKGWKPIAEITTKDTVASINTLGNTVWSKPENTVSYPFEGDMVVLESRCADAVMTPNHRVAYFGQYKGDLRYRRADSIKGKSEVSIPTSAFSLSEDFAGVSDDEVRLVAWILTDGHLGGHVGISQSKPETTKAIGALLDRMNIRYTKRSRNREKRDICGVAVKEVCTSNTFDFTSASGRQVARLFGIANWSHSAKYEKRIPEWVSLLSERQFDIFMDTLVLGDGSNSSTGHKSRCLYGKENFLSQVQELCVVNGHRASLTQRNRKGEPDYWVLNLTKRSRTKTDGRNYSRRPYRGNVHCLTMQEGNFFTRLHGKVHVTGNCRVEKWITDQTMRHNRDSEFLYKMLSPKVLLSLDERGINYYERGKYHLEGLPPGWLKLGKVFFVHELGSGRNAASSAVGKTGGNVVYAHTHQEDTSSLVLPGVGLVKAFNPGCLCVRQPLWRHSNPTGWSHGYGVQFIAASGEFLHLNIPINLDGKSLVGSLISKVANRA